MLKQILVIILLMVSVANAATIQGTIYDVGFEPVENAVIEINTIPKQTIIAVDGTYLIEVSPGKYNLTAIKVINGRITDSTQEEVNIETETGTYQIDLVLFPSLEDEFLDSGQIDFGLKDEYFKPQTFLPLIIVILLLVIFTIIIIGFKKRKPQEKQEQPVRLEKEPILAADLEKLMQILKSHDNRMHQKQLRKELNLSEAKVSLMISDLESQGKLRKIKKGRGNIIILQE